MSFGSLRSAFRAQTRCSTTSRGVSESIQRVVDQSHKNTKGFRESSRNPFVIYRISALLVVRVKHLGRDAAAIRHLHALLAGPLSNGLVLLTIRRGRACLHTSRTTWANTLT